MRAALGERAGRRRSPVPSVWLPRAGAGRLRDEVRRRRCASPPSAADSLQAHGRARRRPAARPEPGRAATTCSASARACSTRDPGAAARGVRRTASGCSAASSPLSASSRVFERSERLPHGARAPSIRPGGTEPAGVRGLPARQGHRDAPRDPAVGPRARGGAPQRRGPAGHTPHLGPARHGRGWSGLRHPSRDAECAAACWRGVALVVLAVGAAASRVRPKRDRADREARLRRRSSSITDAEPEPKPPPKRENPRPGRPTATTPSAATSRPTTTGRPTGALVDRRATTRSSSRPRSATASVYLAQQKGLFFALDAKTGKLGLEEEQRALRGLVARRSATGSSTSRTWTLWCARRAGRRRRLRGGLERQDRPRALALQVGADRVLAAAPDGLLYVGSWDHNVYAIDAKTGRKIWSFQADDEVNTSAAYWQRTIYIAPTPAPLRAERAHREARAGARSRRRASARASSSTPRRPWPTAASTSATPTARCTSSGPKSGKLLWARPLGTYIYGAAAVWKRRVFVGTYDGKFYALDAATGDTRWQSPTPGAVHAAPTVMAGLVYYRDLLDLRVRGPARREAGPRRTFALGRRTRPPGRGSNRAGKYANPVVADEDRVYAHGSRPQQFAFRAAPTASERRRQPRPSAATAGSSC